MIDHYEGPERRAPSGTPSAVSDRVPLYYDTTNNFLYIYNGGWKKTTVFA